VPVTIPDELATELWAKVKDLRDHYAMAAAREDQMNALLKQMQEAGLADHLPTIEEMQAAGPWVRAKWDE
jgi:hypothetical protein